jgi:transposase
VVIADAQNVKGLAALACKTDRIDAWVLAEPCRRDLALEIWLSAPGGRSGNGSRWPGWSATGACRSF